MSRKCRVHSKFGLWYKWLIFLFLRGGHLEMHRSLKTDCLGSILGGRQFFVLIFFCNIHFFPIFSTECTIGMVEGDLK